MRRFAVVMFGAAALCAAAQEKPCPPAEATRAEQGVDRVVNWVQLYKAYQDYRHCDKGNVSELFTEALLRCIVEWKNVEGLAKPMEKDADYRAFVVKHLASPEAKGDLNDVYSRAKMNCPKGLEAFCADIQALARPSAGLEAFKPMEPLGAEPKKAADPKK
jgi:hypothetical protein